MEKDSVIVCERLRGMGGKQVKVHLQTVISVKLSLDGKRPLSGLFDKMVKTCEV
jgi:hypothetical protein